MLSSGGRFAAAAVAIALAVVCPAASAARGAPCTTRVAGGDWPSYGHDLANTRSQPAEHGIGTGAVAKLAPAWVSAAGDGSSLNGTPVVYDGCVFVGSAGGYVYALAAASGHVVWKRQVDVFNQGAGGAIVGAGAVDGPGVVFLVSGAGSPYGPYAISLDRSTGAVLWRTQRFTTGPGNAIEPGYYTNASPVVANGLVAAGYSPPEGQDHESGGFVLIDARTGAIVKRTPTIPPADQAKGYAGGGLWSTPAYDPATRYLYWGAGNPYSKQQEDPHTNAILKIDLDRARATFGEIVASYKGNVDQYASALQALSRTPACAVSDNSTVPSTLDDPVCGQIDLDFGASPNLFTTSGGTELVGELQKSGVYHAARADTMQPAWTSIVGVSCQWCNAASTAFAGDSIYGVGAPGGELYSLAHDTGTANWLAPVGDALHYASSSVADGVVWTADSAGFLDAFDAASGRTLIRRPLSLDAGAPIRNLGSGGVAIAEHTVFAEVGAFAYGSAPGYVIAYRGG